MATTPLTTDEEKATVFIVDDHPLVREWLTYLINQQPDLRTCGDASSPAEALKLISDLKPRIVIVDISLEEGSGIELIRAIKAAVPDSAVIVLSVHDESLYAERALRAGARGYVMKRDVTKKVLQAVRSVLKGDLFLSEKAAMMVAALHVEGRLLTDSPVARLSDRELRVFELLGRGCSNRQIGLELNVSFKTVQAFCARIKAKLKLTNKSELLRVAVLWNNNQPSH